MTNGLRKFVVASRHAPCLCGFLYTVRLSLKSRSRSLKLETGLPYNQIINNLISQAAVMETSGVPNDVVNNLDPLTLLIFIPICDLFVYPGLRRIGINFTPIKRITAGFLFGSVAMVWAAVVQHYIYKACLTTLIDEYFLTFVAALQTNPCGEFVSTCQDADGNPITSSLNVWIQSGSYILIALSEILASITGLEYAFTKAPKNMRSFVMAVFLFTSAISSAIGEAFNCKSCITTKCCLTDLIAIRQLCPRTRGSCGTMVRWRSCQALAEYSSGSPSVGWTERTRRWTISGKVTFSSS